MNTTHWLYSIEPDLGGEENMRRDEEMARLCAADGISRLRFYSWNPWTLSLGYNQDDSKIDTDALARRGYGIVRRPTGGRAVFHADELTYGVAMPSRGEGVHETYARISSALKRGLEILGAEGIEFSRSQPDFREHYTGDDSASCFSASALNELTWHGRKLVGSAQRRYGDVLLQHGSLLMGEAHLEIVDLLYSGADAARRGILKQRLAERTVALDEIFGGASPVFTAVADALSSGFREVFDVELRYVERHAELLLPNSY